MCFYFQTLIYSMGYIIFLFIIPCAFVTVLCHEFAKAFVAKKLGCLSDKKINSNPLRFVSVLGLILMSITGYGWGKPQECNIGAVSKPKRILYYFSGSMGNIICAVGVLVIQSILLTVMLLTGMKLAGWLDTLLLILNLIMWLQILMAITQLIPVPGFAGYNILKTLFFDKVSNPVLTKVEQNGKWIFTVLVLLGVMYYVVELPTSVLYTGISNAEEWFVDMITGGLYTEAGW